MMIMGLSLVLMASTRAVTAMAASAQLVMEGLISPKTAAAINAATPTPIPWRAMPYLLALSLARSLAKITMIMMEGATTPKVARAAPGIPAYWYPTKVAELIAMGPGVISEMAMMLRNSAWFSQPWAMISFCMRGIMA